MISREALLDNFKNPPKQFRVIPFWFLNHGFDKEELERQIREMDEKGVGGAVLHPRHGMSVPYMSEEYLQMIGTCIEAMDERGMQAWLYDENNWPSGTFDGRLTRENPQYRMRYIRIESLRVEGGKHLKQALKLEEGNIVIDIQAARYEECGNEILVHRDSVSSIQDKYSGGFVSWEVPAGNWLICVFWECVVAPKVTYKNGYYLDTMNEEAVRAFIEAAYEPYLRFSEYFGHTVQGVFTDEPGLMVHDGFFQTEAIRTRTEDLQYNLGGYTLAWTRDFFHKFKILKGYDFRHCLFALIYNIGEETRKIRLDYYDAITTWYVDCYHKAISGWCRSHGLKYIGHTLEEPLWGQVRSQGNQTRVLQNMDYPGYDYLGQGVGTKENPHRILAAKCASSVAHLEGKQRVVCEAFGGGGHNHSLFTRKLDANFMAILGTNLFIPHGFYYSFEGYRKTDWPPTEFYHAPHWQYYKGYADYLARLSIISSAGIHKAMACILSPVKTVSLEMFEDGIENTNPRSDSIFSITSDLMLRSHYDFDYMDDCQLQKASVAANGMRTPESDEAFGLLILPGVKVISLEGAEKIKQLHQNGGKVIFIDCLPTKGDLVSEDDGVRDIFTGILSDGVVNGSAILVRYDESFEANLRQALAEMVIADVRITCADGSAAEDVIYCRRDMGESSFYLFFNRLMIPQAVHAEFYECGDLYEWDFEQGTEEMIYSNRKTLDLELSEAQMRLIEVRKEQKGQNVKTGIPAKEGTARFKPILSLDGMWKFHTKEPNVLKLDQWTYKARDRKAMDREGVTGAPGQVDSYTASFFAEDVPEGGLRMVLDDLKQWIPSHFGFLTRKRSLEIYVNNEKVETLRSSGWQEKHFLEADIGNLVKKGENTIVIHTLSLLNPMHGLREPVYILGSFELRDQRIRNAGGEIDGYWTDNGYPYFSGVGVYEKEFEVQSGFFGNGTVMLSVDGLKDGCRVVLNGKPVRTLYWPPYQVDVTEFIAAGVNKLEIEVFNTLENLYGSEAVKSGFLKVDLGIGR